MRTGKQPNTSTVQYREIDADHAGQRVDNFLISKLKGIPKSHIYRILRKGEVRINRGRCPPDYRLKAGDIVRIPPVRLSTSDQGRRFDLGRPMTLSILFEDDDLLAVDKPARLAVHGGSGVAWGLIEGLRVSRPRARFLELVHRLDRDTSGCLLVAKRRSALVALHEQLRGAEIEKRYTALVRGRLPDHVRKVEAPLLKFRLRSGERKVEVSQTGRAAATQFVPKCLYANATQVEIGLLTGRTHQARVHAAHIDHPIAGDAKYGDREFNRSLRGLGLNRLFLHAHSLTFRHPRDGGRLVIESTLPPELAMLLDSLDSSSPTAGRDNGPICPSAVLADGGRGARFVIELNGESVPAFAVRFRGKVYAYVNQCAHQSLELDWSKGSFFDVVGDFLMCATHGARYYPDTGACAGGRCDGQPLIPLSVLERDDQVYLAVDGAHLITGLEDS